MTKSTVVTGGWMDYTKQVNILLGRNMTPEEYKVAMSHYLKSQKPQTVVEKINGSI